MVLDFSMAKNLIEEAVEFGLNNLDTFPFSRLPNGLQLEIIEELNVTDKIQLFKVNSGLQGYVARNGPFGRHVDLIQTISGQDSHLDARRAAGLGRFLLPNFDLNLKEVLFRKIRSCEKFLMKPSYGDWEMVSADSYEGIANYIADCFGNLRVVSELRASRLYIPIRRKILTALQFEVTDWAELNLLNHKDRTDFSEVADFLKSYLENQLRNCKRVAIIGDFKLDLELADKVLKEIPGFQLEEDPKKVEKICKAYNTNKALVVSPSEVKCYRREIGNGKPGLVLVAFTDRPYSYADYYLPSYSRHNESVSFPDSGPKNQSPNLSVHSDVHDLDSDGDRHSSYFSYYRCFP